MTKKYVSCMVFHPYEKKRVEVDIEVEAKEEITQEDNSSLIYGYVINPIINEFIMAGLDAIFPEDTLFYDQYQQSDYVGTVDEIIHRILDESGGDI